MDFERVIHACRLQLEEAGNPAFVAAVVDASGATQLSSVIYSTVRPASDHGLRIAADLTGGETVIVVARQEQDERAHYTILDPDTLKRLHQQIEVVERSFADEDVDV